MNKTSIEISNKRVIKHLSNLITAHLLNAAYEQYTPSSDPDKMDSIIADGQKKAKELRRLREEFENISTGIIAPY